MSRPHCYRKITGRPLCAFYAPGGAPAPAEDAVSLTLDEFEALRLADFEGLYQEDAAGRMRISRPTFGRIVESAHRKVAQALVKAKPLRIEDGVRPAAKRLSILCDRCPRRRNRSRGIGSSAGCPRCQGEDARRTDRDTPVPAREGGPGRASSSKPARLNS
jgi:predicted DNA-binding protein (UPF0251 family)